MFAIRKALLVSVAANTGRRKPFPHDLYRDRGGRCLTESRGGASLAALNNRLNQIVIRVTVLTLPRP